ncbi:hypothetical protein [Sporolactobacillus pectinivorans]|uniref:hypothetical protein n=1 Tax=Sporolactobacillus pectinivorans TaxID=1591408 RepID=UPI000C26917D|nr:hypothetical protein [Sporolactobacillus pectinivorans]
MSISTNNSLLNPLLKTQSTASPAASVQTNQSTQLSSEFADLLAMLLMNNSSSQMFDGLSSDGTDTTDSSLDGLSSSPQSSADSLLWNLLSTSLDPSATQNTSAASVAPASSQVATNSAQQSGIYSIL